MATVTGSKKVGYCTLYADVDTSAPSATITLYWTTPKVKLGSCTVTEDDASASIGGKYLGTKVEGTITADWANDKITYALDIGGSSYSGTLITW
jgi:hypothetical protein